jgi:hypothetical protein
LLCQQVRSGGRTAHQVRDPEAQPEEIFIFHRTEESRRESCRV